MRFAASLMAAVLAMAACDGAATQGEGVSPEGSLAGASIVPPTPASGEDAPAISTTREAQQPVNLIARFPGYKLFYPSRELPKVGLGDMLGSWLMLIGPNHVDNTSGTTSVDPQDKGPSTGSGIELSLALVSDGVEIEERRAARQPISEDGMVSWLWQAKAVREGPAWIELRIMIYEPGASAPAELDRLRYEFVVEEGFLSMGAAMNAFLGGARPALGLSDTQTSCMQSDLIRQLSVEDLDLLGRFLGGDEPARAQIQASATTRARLKGRLDPILAKCGVSVSGDYLDAG